MKILAVKQPWAKQIIDGKKTIEIRTMNTHVRERVALYATLTKPKQQDIEWLEWLGYSVDGLAKGYIIGTVEICGAETVYDQNDFHNNLSKHLCYQNMYKNNLWNWYLQYPKKIKPIKFKMPKGAVVWSSIDDRLMHLKH